MIMRRCILPNCDLKNTLSTNTPCTVSTGFIIPLMWWIAVWPFSKTEQRACRIGKDKIRWEKTKTNFLSCYDLGANQILRALLRVDFRFMSTCMIWWLGRSFEYLDFVLLNYSCHSITKSYAPAANQWNKQPRSHTSLSAWAYSTATDKKAHHLGTGLVKQVPSP